MLEGLLRPAALRFGVELTEERLTALSGFAGLLLEWNRRINLTGAADLRALGTEHIADALALVPHLPERGPCVDVGSGAGLPGVVLAVIRSDLEITLLEPIAKRRAFLGAVARALPLRNVTISEDRFEQHATSHAGRYAFAVARAVFPLGRWLSIGPRLVRPGGLVVGLAGGDALEVPAGAEVIRYDAGAGSRAIVLVRA